MSSSQDQLQPQHGWREERGLWASSALWSFAIDDDSDPVYSRLYRLTRPLQISTLRHGLTGLRQTGHNHHRAGTGEFSDGIGLVESSS